MPPQLRAEVRLDRVEAVRHPSDDVRVAAVLAHEIGGPPEVAHRRAREAERQQTGVQAASFARRFQSRARQDLGGAGEPVGRRTEKAGQPVDGALLAGGQDRVAVGLRPCLVHCGDHRHWVEHTERRGDDLPRHLTHARATAREVRRDRTRASRAPCTRRVPPAGSRRSPRPPRPGRGAFGLSPGLLRRASFPLST